MKINIFNETANPRRFRLVKVNGSASVNETDNPSLMMEGDIITSCLSKAGVDNKMWSLKETKAMWKKNAQNFMWSRPREQFLQWNKDDTTLMWNSDPEMYMWEDV